MRRFPKKAKDFVLLSNKKWSGTKALLSPWLSGAGLNVILFSDLVIDD